MAEYHLRTLLLLDGWQAHQRGGQRGRGSGRRQESADAGAPRLAAHVAGACVRASEGAGNQQEQGALWQALVHETDLALTYRTHYHLCNTASALRVPLASAATRLSSSAAVQASQVGGLARRQLIKNCSSSQGTAPHQSECKLFPAIALTAGPAVL